MKVIIVVVLFIIGAAGIVGSFYNQQHKGIIEPVVLPSGSQPIINDTTIETQPIQSGDLKIVVDGALALAVSTYGVVVKNLTSGESYSVNEHRVFEPASLYKLWVMATVFDQIQNGQLSENDVLSQDVNVLNEEFHISTQSAELTEGTITMTVSDAVKQMITISDNYASLLLAEKVKNSQIQQFLIDHGFSESSLGEPPQSTPHDIALFFEKLYKGALANEKYSQKMIDLLKQQKLNSKIPKYLPKDMVIAHKTGEIGSFTHDAGIIYGSNQTFILVILSEGNNPLGSEERIATISQAVYRYFESVTP